jgi:hypothetical protein
MGDSGKVRIHGRDYKTVAKRIEEFRQSCPLAEGWAVATEFLELTTEQVICRASIVNPAGVAVATGHAHETWTGQINKTSAVENCETSAIGRALAAAGFGGSEFASADEVVRVISQRQKAAENKPTAKPLSPDQRYRLIANATDPTLRKYSEKIAREVMEGSLEGDEAAKFTAAIERRRKELAELSRADAGPASDSELFDTSPVNEGVGV